MLLSSAMSGPLSCDSLQTTRRQSARFFASPPSSPPNALSQSPFPGNLMSSCQSLQSIMASSTQATNFWDTSYELPPPEMAELPTPPLAYASPPRTRSSTNSNANTTNTPSSGKRLLVRSRGRSSTVGDRVLPRKRIVKRASTPTPSPNKRRRAAEDDGNDQQPTLDSDEELDADLDTPVESNHLFASELPAFEPQPQAQDPEPPSTPKRSRIAPEQLPLGLDRSDFHRQYQDDPAQLQHQRGQGTDVECERADELWSVEDDKILIELVLAKMKLKPEDWRDCAQVMGRDRHSLDRRWKSLMANNHVGLNRRRPKLHATWR